MSNDDENWRSCKPGELAALAARVNRRQRRRQFLRAASAVSVAALATVGGGVIWSKFQEAVEYRFAGIGCNEVQELVMQLRLEQLSPAVRRQIREHAAQCPHCGPKLREMGITPEMFSMRAPPVA